MNGLNDRPSFGDLAEAVKVYDGVLRSHHTKEYTPVTHQMDRRELLSEVIGTIESEISQRAEETVSFPIEFTFRLVLERIHSSLKTLSRFSDDELIINDHAIGLICRNILSDYLLASYLIKKPKDREEQNMLFYSIYWDDFKRVDKHMHSLLKKGVIDKPLFESYQMNYGVGIPEMVKDYCVEYKCRKSPSITDVYEWAVMHRDSDGWASEMILAFENWLYYSKYEHLGWHSYGMTRHKWNTKDRSHSRLKAVLDISLSSAAMCLDVLKNELGRDRLLSLKNNR